MRNLDRTMSPVALIISILALVVATSAGTAYAAVQIGTKQLKNSAVTNAKIKNNAVTSAKIRNRTVKAGDIAVGVVPADGYIFGATYSNFPTPSAPSYMLSEQTFKLPREGVAYVRAFSGQTGVTCSVGGDARAGLYVDGKPVPDTGVYLNESNNPEAVEMQGSIRLSAGDHTLGFGFTCTNNSWSVATHRNRNWTVMLAAQ